MVYITLSVHPDTAGECGLTQFLMSEVARLQKVAQDERRARHELSAQVAEHLDSIRQLQLRESELHKQQDRVQRIREERERICEEARKLKDENYRLMHDLTRLSEEKNSALMCNRDLQLEVINHSINIQESMSGTCSGHSSTQNVKKELGNVMHLFICIYGYKHNVHVWGS